MKAIIVNVVILGFLLTLYVYINTDSSKPLVSENSARTFETDSNEKSGKNFTENAVPDDITYRVKEGDTLSDIGNEFKVPVADIKTVNGLTGDDITVGQYIDIPPSQIESQTSSDEGNILLAQAETLQTDEQKEQQLRRQKFVEERRQEMLKKREQYKQETFQETIQDEGNVREQQTTQPESPAEIPQADTEEETVIVTDGEIVNLQSEMDIQDLIQTISEITGSNFVLDESVKGKKITVIAPGGFKKENAMRLFETVLSLNGFSAVKKNGTIVIVPKRDVKISSIPTEVGSDYGEPSDSFITRLIELKNIKAGDAANILRPLISREGDIVVYPTTNTLIIIETVDNLNRILKILESLDVETEIEFIKIHNAEAAEVAAKLVEIFGGVGGTTSASQTRTAQAQAARTAQRQSRTSRTARRTTQQTEQPAAITSQSTADSSAVGFKVITDERTNSLIVIAYPEDMAKIKAVIEILDVETDEPEEGIFVIRVLNADAEQLVSVLSSLFGGGGGGFRSSQTALGTAQRNTSGFTSQTGFNTTGSQTGVSRQPIQRQNTSFGSSVVAETENLRITADPATNSIIVIGSRRDYESIKEVIQELDIRRKQVFVEAAILEVSLDKLRSFGTNLSIGFTINDDNLAFGGTNLPGVPSLLGAAANPDATVNLVGSLSGLFLGVVGEEVDPDGSGPIPPIPSFTALFQAITSLTDVNVLSTPSIITTDNEPAEIIVADVIPFPTGSTVGDSGVTVQTIEREPVGIRLSITPQISEGDFLNLNILTEVSAIRNAPADLNTAEFGIATTTRTADSSVVVKNGQTIVIGGLVQDRESVLQNRVPVLGKIPVLGNLFKFKQRQSTKINLMILLTPRIIETERDMELLLEERQNRNMLLQERGFNREE